MDEPLKLFLEGVFMKEALTIEFLPSFDGIFRKFYLCGFLTPRICA